MDPFYKKFRRAIDICMEGKYLDLVRATKSYPEHNIGKVGFKVEPAGKIRVFAMVDP